MSNIFDKILVTKPKRSKFNLSHEVKMTANYGLLYPYLCQEVLPGDSWKVQNEIFVRSMPMVAPIFHRINIRTYHFFVPMRLIWDKWEEFITGGEDGLQQPVIPFFRLGAEAKRNAMFTGSLADYLGFPTCGLGEMTYNEQTFNLLPFKAYALIWNEYFRNQNIQEPIDIFKDKSGEYFPNQQTIDNFNRLISLQYKCWEKDYFTSALIDPQRGVDVPIPFKTTFTLTNKKGPNTIIRNAQDGSPAPESEGSEWSTNQQGKLRRENGVATQIDVTPHLEVTSGALGANINDLRMAEKLQKFYEKAARGGSRYVEQLLSFFGVRASDARLQRPEFLGGSVSPFTVEPVAQTSSTGVGDTPQANLAGNGVGYGFAKGCKKFFEEHGYIISLMCILPRTNYSQGVPRQFLRKVKEDFYFPEFANLGEQEVTNAEVYCNPKDSACTVAQQKEKFGYQQRYSEYKYIPSSVHGMFRDTLDFWHLGRVFDSPPALNDDFVKANSVRYDSFAVANDSEDHFLVDIYNHINAVRPLPKYSIPSL
jgi:hypothetical protein